MKQLQEVKIPYTIDCNGDYIAYWGADRYIHSRLENLKYDMETFIGCPVVLYSDFVDKIVIGRDLIGRDIAYEKPAFETKHASFYENRVELKRDNVADVLTTAPSAGGIKNDAGKPRADLLPSAALLEVAKVLNFGATKYADNNWRKGFAWSRLYGAALRHIMAHKDGEDSDSESGLSHLSHAACCLLFLLEHELKGLGKDDRHKYDTAE